MVLQACVLVLTRRFNVPLHDEVVKSRDGNSTSKMLQTLIQELISDPLVGLDLDACKVMGSNMDGCLALSILALQILHANGLVHERAIHENL